MHFTGPELKLTVVLANSSVASWGLKCSTRSPHGGHVMCQWDSLWGLQPWSHLEDIMGCIHLGGTEYDLTDGLQGWQARPTTHFWIQNCSVFHVVIICSTPTCTTENASPVRKQSSVTRYVLGYKLKWSKVCLTPAATGPALWSMVSYKEFGTFDDVPLMSTDTERKWTERNTTKK